MNSLNLSDKAKGYIQNKKIPELFEALMTALMCNQPDDHIGFIMNSMKMMKEKKINSVSWNTFVNDENNKNKNG